MNFSTMSDEQFAEAAKAEPGAAILYANDRYQDLKNRGML